VIIEINNTKRNHRDRQPPIKVNQNNMPVVAHAIALIVNVPMWHPSLEFS
jgi:hypothetical protein